MDWGFIVMVVVVIIVIAIFLEFLRAYWDHFMEKLEDEFYSMFNEDEDP